jgi:hypothetical protein
MDTKGTGSDVGAPGNVLSLVPKDKTEGVAELQNKVCNVYNTTGTCIAEIPCNQMVGVTDDVYGCYQIEGDFSYLRGLVNMSNIAAIDLTTNYNADDEVLEDD